MSRNLIPLGLCSSIKARSLPLLLGLLALITVACAPPSPLSGKFRSGSEVTLGGGETIGDDLYAAAGVVNVSGEAQGDVYATGGNLEVSGTVKGDAALAGGSVDVRGPVEGDLAAVGGSIVVAAPVGDDARLFGGSIAVRAPVADDLLAFGGSVSLGQGAMVGGDFVASGGSVRVDGVVEGNASISAGETVIAGVIKGDVELEGEVTLKSTARIEGDLRYTSVREVRLEPGAQVLGATSREVPTVGLLWLNPQVSTGVLALKAVIHQLQWFLGVMAVGLLLLWAAPATYVAAADTLRRSPWKSLGVGVLLLVAIPIGVLVAAIVAFFVGGFAASPVLVVPVALYLVAFSLATPVVALFLGRIALGSIGHRKNVPLWQGLALGAGTLAVMGLVPGITWIMTILVLVFSFGAWMLLGYRRYSQARRAGTA